MSELSNAAKAMQAEAERFVRLAGDELTVYSEGLCFASVCTSLTDEQADALMAQRPSGTAGGWRRSADSHFTGGLPNPCPCEHQRGRRHVLYEA